MFIMESQNDENGFTQIISLAEDIKNTILIFEPTGIYSYALSEFCSKKKIQVVMVGPKESRDFARSLKVRSKTDKIDAKVLYKYQSHVEPMVKIPEINQHAVKIQEMLNVYESILSAKQKFKNQIESTSKLHKDLLRTLNKLIDETEALRLFNKVEDLLLKEESAMMQSPKYLPLVKSLHYICVLSF